MGAGAAPLCPGISGGGPETAGVLRSGHVGPGPAAAGDVRGDTLLDWASGSQRHPGGRRGGADRRHHGHGAATSRNQAAGDGMNTDVTSELPEHHSPTAARIVDAAQDLLQRRGSKAVTIAAVAQKAHVGTGTVYLYWSSKSELL